jgi:tetratricopeptide (TPR) repeat protein
VKISESFDSVLRAVAASPAIPIPPAGGALGGRFELLRRLGEGGFGLVFEARDRSDGQRVALKLLRSSNPSWLARFKREFRALQGIVHPNLVTLHELIFADGHWFLTMELVSGAHFTAFLRAARPPAGDSAVRARTAMQGPPPGEPLCDPQRTRDALRQLFEGLAWLHRAGHVHRDVKPSNVLVTAEGRVVLLDFGLVTSDGVGANDVTSASGVVGTPLYMAPEQAAGRSVGRPADLYAVGVMLYEILTAHPPFSGSAPQLLMAKQTTEPSRPSSLVGDVPPDLDLLCAQLLRTDPALRPSVDDALRALDGAPNTRAALEPQPAQVSSRRPPATLVGRHAEIAVLEEAVHATRRGEAANVVVAGESGIGKSSMLRRFAEELTRDRPGAVVLAGRCSEGETIPYKTLDGVVEALARRLGVMPYAEVEAILPARAGALARVFPAMARLEGVRRMAEPAEPRSNLARLSGERAEPRSLLAPLSGERAEPYEARRRAFLALRDLFTRLAVRQPLAVFIDDLQWADADGLRALAELLRPPDAPPMLFVGAIRAETRGVLRGVVPEETRWIDLLPLELADATDMAAAALRNAGTHDTDARRIAAEAKGHPLFVEELARHVALHGAPREGVSLNEAIGERVRGLRPAARAIVEIVAVGGGPSPRDIVAAASRVEPSELRRAVSALSAANLIRVVEGPAARTLEPYHDRVREAVVACMDPEGLRDLHARIAAAYEVCAEHDPERLAMHWRDAGNVASATVYALEAAALASKACAFDRAAQWYEQALAWLPEGDARCGHLHGKLGDALALSGRGEQAARHFEAAARDAAPEDALVLRRRAAEQLLRTGRFDRGIAASRAALAAVGLALPSGRLVVVGALLYYRLRLWMRGLALASRGPRSRPAPTARDLARIDTCWSIGYALLFVDTFVGQVLEMRALLMALAAGELERSARCVGVELAMSAVRGRRAWPRTSKLMVAANDLATRAGSAEARWYAQVACGTAFFLTGHFRRAADELEGALSLTRDGALGLVWEQASTRVVLISVLAAMGRYRELREVQEEGMREAEGRGDLWGSVTMRMADASVVWLLDDRPSVLEAQVERAMREWTTSGFHIEHHASLRARIAGRLYAGDAEGAYRMACHFVRRVRRSTFWFIETLRINDLYLRGASALAVIEQGRGDTRRLLRVVERDAAAIERERATWAAGLVTILRAGHALHAPGGRLAAHAVDVACERLRRAAIELEAADMKGYATAVRDRAAQAARDERVAADCAEWFRAEGVASPARFIAMLTPGFGSLTEVRRSAGRQPEGQRTARAT